ncbi:PREDICTED: uncharacterized protein LOC106746156 [Dinoponera quadriceps]|uniref:Uncharacterized protein LOC106746156 n=1 Tax=Dinoponera quadriceps TaxID=609295 RepID=A0A6P3XHE2_DINQU|nr:PREDICTED: uncharacterized protein LOC106746156 [Dinoponera quadriceps]
MTKTLKDVGGTVEKNVLAFAFEHMLNAICDTNMGTSLHGLNVAQEEYLEKIQQLGSLLVYRYLINEVNVLACAFLLDSEKKEGLAMLDFVIATSREHHLTNRNIRVEVDTFTLEGHDTMATAISYTLLLIAEHKEIQK